MLKDEHMILAVGLIVGSIGIIVWCIYQLLE